MSEGTKRPLAEAVADAEAFNALFPESCYQRWTVAGSVRRRAPECGDCEHVVIPRTGTVPGSGLFADEGNLLWNWLENLLAGGHVGKHVYGASGFRWGPLYRGVDYRGHLHEIFTTLPDGSNYGPTLAIRTGPAEFSQKLVTGLLRNGRRNYQGQVWMCDPCPFRNNPNAVLSDRCDKSCSACQGTGLVPVEVIPCPTEELYFNLCGLPWVKPEERR